MNGGQLGLSTVATLCLAVGASVAAGASFYVAPEGKEGGTGSREQPFAALEAARDAARKAAAGPHKIVLLQGEYFRLSPFELDARDNDLTVESAGTNRVVLYGGRQVKGWRRDGEKFWCADLPEVKAGKWDFRGLVVNGRMPERARFPECGTFKHKSAFDVRWLTSVGGGWERKPTANELTTLVYNPTNLQATLDVRNAEVRVYHMWNESLVGVASNDVVRHTLHFTTPAISPAGAFGVKKYVIFNTREGMTKPGQWYLDRSAGKVVYWPLPGEDMGKVKVVAPALERVIRLAGTDKAPVERVTLRGFSVQASTTPLKPAGFSAGAYDGAVSVVNLKACAFENLEICNVAGQGIKADKVSACRIEGCRIYGIGACGIRASGRDTLIAGNHIHHTGVFHPSAVAIQVHHSPKEPEAAGIRVYRNEVHDAPYCGIIGTGSGHCFEENLIYRVMLEMQDGGGIYGMMTHTVLRGNVVRDVVKMGDGYGVSAYYLDEGSEHCVVERNVSIGVERPIHMHIANDLVIRDNVFVAATNLTLSFQSSRNCTVTGNMLYAPGKVTVSPPTAVTAWTNNVVMQGGQGRGAPQAFAIGGDMPAAAAPGRRKHPINVVRVSRPPVLDGEIGTDEWPGDLQYVSREPSRWSAGGAPVYAEFAYDEHTLYVAVNVVLFDIGKLGKGGRWGRDDAAEICIAGKEGTFVLRGFADGALASVTDAGAPHEAADRLGKAARFTAKPYGKVKGDWKSGWRGEWAIPFAALGITPAPGKTLAFNLSIYRAEDGVWRCLEGTQAETWRVDQAAALRLK